MGDGVKVSAPLTRGRGGRMTVKRKREAAVRLFPVRAYETESRVFLMDTLL